MVYVVEEVEATALTEIKSRRKVNLSDIDTEKLPGFSVSGGDVAGAQPETIIKATNGNNKIRNEYFINYSIIPPPTRSSPSYNATDCPGVIARRASSNAT